MAQAPSTQWTDDIHELMQRIKYTNRHAYTHAEEREEYRKLTKG